MHAVRFRFPFDPAGSRIFDPGVLYYRGSLFTEAAALLYLCSTKCLPLASVIASSVGLLASFSCLVRLVSSVCGFVVFLSFLVRVAPLVAFTAPGGRACRLVAMEALYLKRHALFVP